MYTVSQKYCSVQQTRSTTLSILNGLLVKRIAYDIIQLLVYYYRKV